MALRKRRTSASTVNVGVKNGRVRLEYAVGPGNLSEVRFLVFQCRHETLKRRGKQRVKTFKVASKYIRG